MVLFLSALRNLGSNPVGIVNAVSDMNSDSSLMFKVIRILTFHLVAENSTCCKGDVFSCPLFDLLSSLFTATRQAAL